MDIQMPDIDGFETTRRIRALAEERGDEALAKLPVIAMTAHAMAGDREKSLEAGMDDHVAKPIDPDELFGALLRWIEPGEREVPETAATPRPTDDETLPDLPGIDVAGGLARVGGNRGAYLRILRRFAADNRETTAGIRQAIEEEDLETAARLAHTVKGVSGNVGATSLYQIAADLESSLREGVDEATPGRIERFDEALGTVLATLAVVEEDGGSGEVTREIDRDAIAEMTREIGPLLESDLTGAVDRVEALGSELAGTELQHDAKRLGDLVDRFDMDGAKEALKRLEERLDVD
jgi:CheY-like chemotaxis protein